ncbi:hypothetical protein [Thalassovita mediterranea]|uniref:Uncharacterized protein n=1 Tax=Thalassovita mediterranea TaxID=340021 RepID=A0A0P1HFE8_9RHOB|nr:hypothetical protein [Thalassovita mediterranea]CUH85706.1 hypothetical protein TM5383_02940 [Thalassovita mediterranea]SIS29884.1 hypothetical protein SAMN05421685_102111 [Thalassovita mediterranea]
MIRRSSAAAIAVTFQHLMSSAKAEWTLEQRLVCDALRRSKASLNDATDGQLAAYLCELEPAQLQGVASNVKGIFHELLVAHMENTDGDAVSARLFEQTNQPGADLEFEVDGEVVRALQLKAVQDPAALAAHFEAYPDIEVLATEEVVSASGGIFGEAVASSELRNEDLSRITHETFDALSSSQVEDAFSEAAVGSALIAGAIQARAVLTGQHVDKADFKDTLETMGIATGAALTVEAVLGLL